MRPSSTLTPRDNLVLRDRLELPPPDYKTGILPHEITEQNTLVQPARIELASEALQAPAMTTSAKVALVPCRGNDPRSLDYQSSALPLS